jgi:hypothetical protein
METYVKRFHSAIKSNHTCMLTSYHAGVPAHKIVAKFRTLITEIRTTIIVVVSFKEIKKHASLLFRLEY